LSRAPHTFRKSDLERALKAAKAAGFTVVQIDAKTGTFIATAESVSISVKNASGWDKVVADLESKS
jgi:acetolactate synthase regulatory subunit